MISKGISAQVFTDEALIHGVRKHIYKCAEYTSAPGEPSTLYIETAGGRSFLSDGTPSFNLAIGVLSPVPSGTLQADAYRPFRFPTVLVGDSRLGGISSTISAYESLNSRGYDVDAVVMFSNQYYRNHEFLNSWFGERGIGLVATNPPPPRTPKKLRSVDLKRMFAYYARASTTSEARSLVLLLDAKHKGRVRALQDMPERAMASVWYPFVQHRFIRSPRDIVTVDSAHKDFFATAVQAHHTENHDSELMVPKFDGSASWWTQGVGHSDQRLNAAASYAAGRFGHVIFPQISHEPAVKLAESLLSTQGKGWASRVFFSDNGSTGMEVALKMALRATATTYPPSNPKPKLEILGVSGSYHGDTLGAMDAAEGGIYNSMVEWYTGRGLWLDPPTLGFEDGELRVRIPWNNRTEVMESPSMVYDVPSRLNDFLAREYEDYIKQTVNEAVKAGRRFGALVMEPLVLGAGGMKFVDPLFQRVFVDVVRAMSNDLLPADRSTCQSSIQTLPVVFDEVFAGLGRLGFASASSVLGVVPDIAVYAKLLTGGLVPMAITLASQEIFSVFLGDEKAAALLHGHSYTAYPVGCAVANTSLDLLRAALKGETFQRARREWGNLGGKSVFTEMDIPPETVPGSLWSARFVNELSREPGIKRVMTLGTVLAFEVRGGASGAREFMNSLQDLLTLY